MRKAEQSDNELREQLKAEQARFKALDAEYESLKNDTLTIQNVAQFVEKLVLIREQWKDSAQEIAHLYKKLHPYFPVGQCAICGSVTSKVVGSGRKHYICIACGHEAVE